MFHPVKMLAALPAASVLVERPVEVVRFLRYFVWG